MRGPAAQRPAAPDAPVPRAHAPRGNVSSRPPALRPHNLTLSIAILPCPLGLIPIRARPDEVGVLCGYALAKANQKK